MKKILICLFGISLTLLITKCKKPEPVIPVFELDEDFQGYWFKLDSEGETLIADADDYIWGLQFEKNGEVTVARLNNNNGNIDIDDRDAVFIFSSAENNFFTGSENGKTVKGTYKMDKVSFTGYDYTRMYFYSPAITDYLPGGNAGDWSVVGNYAKLNKLDGSSAKIGESEITIPQAPWDLTVSYNNATHIASFTWWAKYSDDIDYFQFAILDQGTWTDLSFTTEANPSGVTNDTWQINEIMDWNGGDPWPTGTFTFKIKAVNSAGESLYSEPVDLVINKKTGNIYSFDYRKLSRSK